MNFFLGLAALGELFFAQCWRAGLYGSYDVDDLLSAELNHVFCDDDWKNGAEKDQSR